MMNQVEGYQALRSALSDLRGMTESNAPLLRLINPVKNAIDKLRQEFRDQVPGELARVFKKEPTREEWSRLWKGLGKTDLLALGFDDALALIKEPAQLDSQITEAEKALAQADPKKAAAYQEKAKALAIYMVRGEMTSQNLLTNAWSIAHLLGEKGALEPGKADPLTVGAIDRLTSLYAFQELDPAIRQTLSELSAREVEGMRTVAGFLANTRALEAQRVNHRGTENLVARINGWKGYIPSVAQEGASLQVFDDVEHEKKIRMGYVRVGPYKGDPGEQYPGKRSYYMSTVGGQASFRQGVAQTVHETWQGVDARTGQTLLGKTAGLVSGSKSVRYAKQINQAQASSLDGLAPGECRMPRFNRDGEVAAYERTMDAKMLERLPRDSHLGRMLGVWAMRVGFPAGRAGGRHTDGPSADELGKKTRSHANPTWIGCKRCRLALRVSQDGSGVVSP